ncbi:MAG TPA: hypothetical protein PLH37_03280 [bacterium]|nr:hypothetical protein [bacterium]
MDYHYQQLLLRPTKSNSKCDIYIAEDSLVEDSNLGRLFILIEFFSREKKAKDIIQGIIKNIVTNYYSSPTSNAEISLEQACQSTNINLPDLLDGALGLLHKINILAGVLKDEELHLASSGNIKALVVRHNKLIPIVPEKEILAPKRKETRLFSNLVSGEIKTNDVLIFSNQTLFDYFSREKIKKTIETINPEPAVEYFKNMLLENVNPVSFLALIFKILPEESYATTASKESMNDFFDAQDSMTNLVNLETKTTGVLTAHLWPAIKNKINFLKTLTARKKITPTVAPLTIKFDTTQTEKKHFSTHPFVNFTLKIKNIWQLLLSLPQKTTTFFANLKKMNRRSKIIASCSVLLIIIFIAGIFVLKNHQKTTLAAKNFSDQTKLIEDKISQAEAALIYQNTEEAVNNLKQAQILIVSLPRSTNPWQTKATELELQAQTMLNKIYHIYSAILTPIANLETAENSALKSLIKNNDQLFAVGAKSIYQIEPTQKSFSPLIIDTSYTDGQNWDQDNLIFQNSERKFVTYNLSLKNSNIKSLFLAATITNWSPYADKIYALDPTKKQILKISQPLSNNPQTQNWLQDSFAITEKAVQILVDGDIWLVSNDGKIYRFTRGKNQNFTINNLSKALGNNLKLYTENGWDKIYVLDFDNTRLLTIRKSGTVEEQFNSPEIAACQNFVINNQQDKAWLLCNTQIMEIDLTKK